MLAWVRTYGGSCGNCGTPFVRGEAVLEVTLTGVRRRKQRCTRCAEGEPPPPDLPLLVVRGPVTAPPRPRTSGMTRVSALLPDWKSRSAGEREPGEEG